jgi:hypothetical protein
MIKYKSTKTQYDFNKNDKRFNKIFCVSKDYKLLEKLGDINQEESNENLLILTLFIEHKGNVDLDCST